MFEIKMNKEKCNKLFYPVSFESCYFDSYIQYLPNDETLFQYSKNFKKAGVNDILEAEAEYIPLLSDRFWNYFRFFKDYEKYKDKNLKYETVSVDYTEDYIIFEFETEEEAFYFKLKYC